MVFRVTTMALIWCALLAGPVAAQPANVDHEPPAIVFDRTESAFHPDMAVMWLNVVKDGRTRLVPFTNRDLGRLPAIAVDGYINGVVLLSTAPLSLLVNHQPMNPIQENADGHFKVKYFGYLDRTQFWSTFLSEDAEAGPSAPIRSGYSSFPKIPGDALSHAQEFRITVVVDGLENHLMVRHDPPVKLDIDSRFHDREPLDFFYLGNDVHQFDGAAADFRERAQAILAGIASVEAITGSQIVDRINLIDFDGQYNSYTCNGESDIWFYSRLFWNESAAELKIIAAHETLHILSDRLGLPSNSRLRELYADLMGFGPLSRERFVVMATGRPPAPAADHERTAPASHLFGFINETNFIRGTKGGHAQDDLDEFCASFLHTLIYPDRLGPLLDGSIKHKNGFISLTARERRQLRDDYEAVLAALNQEIPVQQPLELRTALKTGLDTTRRLDSAFDVFHKAPQRPQRDS